MTVQLENYKPSNPSAAAQKMRELIKGGFNCPMCGRVAKWYYTCYNPTTEKDAPFRCVAHEMNPVPGPPHWSLEEKISQLY